MNQIVCGEPDNWSETSGLWPSQTRHVSIE